MDNDQYNLWNFDKLKNIAHESKKFVFLCQDCKSKNIDLVPKNISYKTSLDHSDLPSKIRSKIEKLPMKRDAIFQAVELNLLIMRCFDCKFASIVPADIKKTELRKWVNKKYPEVLKL